MNPIELLRFRARVLTAIRQFFTGRGFWEADTPLRVRSPGTEVHLVPLRVLGGARPGDERFLITSPELQLKRLLVLGSGPVFQLGHVFRGGELGPLHQPEFTLLEWYRPGSDYRGMMADTEDLLRFLPLALGLPTTVRWQGRVVDLARPAARLTVAEAFQRYTGAPPPDPTTPAGEAAYYRLLVEQIEPQLGNEIPTFLLDYPPSQASLARIRPGASPVAERTELYVAGVELCNAFSELTDPVEQQARVAQELEARRLLGLSPLPAATEFLEALAQGMPAAGGNALGVDRLVMLLAGAAGIDEVLPFAEPPAFVPPAP